MANQRTGLCLSALIAVAGCTAAAKTSSGSSKASSGFFDREAPVNLKVDDSRAVCDTCIRARRLLTLGDTVGPASLFPPWWYLVRDDAGNYWVSQRGTVKVFDKDGRFIRAVGRLGQGPLEFADYPMPFKVDSLGRVYVLDIDNARITVINQDYSLATDLRVPGSPFDLVGLPGKNRYVANMWVPTPELIGLPLHVVKGDSIIASFGLTQHDAAAERPVAARRAIAVDTHERIVAAMLYEYRIAFWSPTGRHLGNVEGSQLNDPPRKDRLGRRINEFMNQIYAVRLDSADRLWVVTWRVRPDWRRFVTEVVDPNGRGIMYKMKDSTVPTHELYTSRVDVIDLDTGMVIARVENSRAKFHSFIGGNQIMAVESTANGDIRLGIWTLTLTSDTLAKGRQ